MVGIANVLRKYATWLEVRPGWNEYFQIIAVILSYDLLWVLLQSGIVTLFKIPEPTLDPEFERMIEALVSAPIARSGAHFLLVAWLEEAVFRLGPLFGAMFLFSWTRVTQPLIVVVLIVSSALFGLAHIGNFQLDTIGWKGILGISLLVMVNQGMSGLLYGTLFLKYCGLVHFKYSWGAFYTVVLMHWTWDTGIIVYMKVYEVLFPSVG